MTEADRAALVLAARLLEYPDTGFFAAIPMIRAEITQNFRDGRKSAFRDAALALFGEMEKQGEEMSRESYVAIFDHDPAASLYMSWHRYGNDRSQGKAMAALNALYRAAGFDPPNGNLPDYAPVMLEFLSVCEDWAAETLLDGFGAEFDRLEKKLAEYGCPRSKVLAVVLQPLRAKFPDLFKPRAGRDSTARLLARPEPEICPLDPARRKGA